jgi:hypothetical protein
MPTVSVEIRLQVESTRCAPGVSGDILITKANGAVDAETARLSSRGRLQPARRTDRLRRHHLTGDFSMRTYRFESHSGSIELWLPQRPARLRDQHLQRRDRHRLRREPHRTGYTPGEEPDLTTGDGGASVPTPQRRRSPHPLIPSQLRRVIAWPARAGRPEPKLRRARPCGTE